MSSASHNTTLVISNDEIEDINKIIKSLEYSGLLLKGVTETVQNEVKEQKGGILSMLLDEEHIEQEKVKEQKDLFMETNWIFNTASSLN